MKSAALKKARARPGRAAKPANPETLTEQAYRQLEEQIVTLRLKPGEFLSEYAHADPRGTAAARARGARHDPAAQGHPGGGDRSQEAAVGAGGSPRDRAAAG